MPLTDAKIRTLQCALDALENTLTDGHGLFIVALPNGKRYWRVRFRHQKRQIKEKLGDYPTMSLAQARIACSARRARAVIDQSADTADIDIRKTLDDVYSDWYAQWSVGKAERTSFYAASRYKAHLAPTLGSRPASGLKARDLIDLFLVIEAKDRPEVARRVFALSRQILSRGVVRGWIPHNVLAGLKEQDIFRATREVNYARLELSAMPKFLRAVDAYDGSVRVRIATKLLALTFVRTGELIQAKWGQFDIKAALWTIPAATMKARRPHVVPLSPQVLELLALLRDANQIKYGVAGVALERYLFPGDRDVHTFISNNTILKLIATLGYKKAMTGHGFRGVASTALNEFGFRHDVIEAQLAHVQDKVRGAYNHAQYLNERRDMMNFWSAFLHRMTIEQAVPVVRSVAGVPILT
jgi:integrase